MPRCLKESCGQGTDLIWGQPEPAAASCGREDARATPGWQVSSSSSLLLPASGLARAGIGLDKPHCEKRGVSSAWGDPASSAMQSLGSAT